MGSVDDIFYNPSHPYTKMLLQAVAFYTKGGYGCDSPL